MKLYKFEVHHKSTTSYIYATSYEMYKNWTNFYINKQCVCSFPSKDTYIKIARDWRLKYDENKDC